MSDDPIINNNNFSRRRFLQTLGAAAAASAAGGVTNAATIAPESTALLDPTKKIVASNAVTLGPGEVDIKLKINGKERNLKVEPRVTMLDALRDRLDMTGAKKVCDRGSCGACTIIVNGDLMYSCMLLAVECQGSEVETIEGLAPEGQYSNVSTAFAECDALQCGFCTPGFVMTISHHLRNEKKPTMESVRQACRGNLCRCGTYNRVFDAALLAAQNATGIPTPLKKDNK
ncbi:MAG: (2Fe-2S)-binding protein [Planctomycetota bacterium]